MNNPNSLVHINTYTYLYMCVCVCVCIYIYIYYACSLVFLVWALWHGLDDPTCVRSLGVAIWPHLYPSISIALMRPRRPKQYCLQLVIYMYIYIYIYIYLYMYIYVDVAIFPYHSARYVVESDIYWVREKKHMYAYLSKWKQNLYQSETPDNENEIRLYCALWQSKQGSSYKRVDWT